MIEEDKPRWEGMNDEQQVKGRGGEGGGACHD